MRWAGVPGTSLALISATGTTTAQLGLRNVAQELPVTVDTIFEAGSTSKALFSYAVLELVRAGKLDLHASLDSYLPTPYPIADPRGRSITAHHVLTHTSGLPNWRPRDTGPLALSFAPGTAYQYSGEGFYFLQTVVEQITGLSTAQFMRKTLDALGMHRSSYIWREAFGADCA
ncbi:MAG: beta-lactamase family protein, partial [Candidatus Eremiobacteraeota bacterium]|nr:beta-lactamase family protein [Candidatus Eremiobacteraeota bacterium]